MQDESWYLHIEDDSIEQGDLFLNVQIVLPRYSSRERNHYELNADSFFCNIIILTQTCDIAQAKVDTILACPHQPIAQNDGKYFIDEVKTGKRLRYLWLKGLNDDKANMTDRLVDLSRVFLLPKNYILDLAIEQKNRLRLRSPFREHFSHSFAHFISRVALP